MNVGSSIVADFTDRRIPLDFLICGRFQNVHTVLLSVNCHFGTDEELFESFCAHLASGGKQNFFLDYRSLIRELTEKKQSVKNNLDTEGNSIDEKRLKKNCLM